MRSWRKPLTLKRMRPVRGALTTGIITSLITVAFIVALLAFTQRQTASAISAALAQPASRTVTISGSLGPQQQGQATAAIDGQLRRALGPLPFTLYGSLGADGLAVRRGAPALHGPDPARHRITTVIGADQLARQAVLISGRWPGRASAGQASHPRGPVPVAIPAVAAAELGVRTGSVLTLGLPGTSSTVRVRVTGVFRPADRGSPYWHLDPLHLTGIGRSSGFTTYGPLFTDASWLRSGSGPLSANLAAWVAIPARVSNLSAGSMQALAARLQAALSHIRTASVTGSPQAFSPLPVLLLGLAARVLASRTLLLIGLLELLVLSVATLILMARALASARRSETALLRARGAAERQLTGLGMAESALVIAPAVVIGPLLGSWLAHGVASGWPAPLGSASPDGVGLGLWLAAVVAAVAAIPVLLLPSAGSALAAASAATLGGRQRNLGAISRAGADLALVALAAVACWQVATTSHALTVTATGRLSVDPVLLAAPVLAGPACAVLILRLLPLASRLADTAARAGRRAVLPLASWSVSRRPLQLAGPLLMTVLSLATVVLALSQNQASQQSARDQAAFEAGADYRADLPFGPLTLGQVTRMTRLAGVTAALPAVRAEDLIVGGSQATVTVVGLPAAQAGNVVLLRRDLAARPFRQLATAITPAAGTGAAAAGTVLPGRPERISVTAAVRRVATAGGRPARSAIDQPTLSVQLQDAAGLYYAVSLGILPADGRPHTLTGSLDAGRRAAYPLRLAGTSLSFVAPVQVEHDVLTVARVRVASTAGGPFPAGAAPVPHALPARVTRFPAGPNGTPTGADSAVISWLHSPGTLPVLATSSFLAQAGQHVGSVITVPVSNTPVRMRVAGTVSDFPSIPAGVGGLIIDQGALQRTLLAAGTAPLPVQEWWLRASRPLDFRGIAPGLQVTSRAALTAALSRSPLVVSVRNGLAGIAVAAIVLALAGFVVSMSAARGRTLERALLDALGMPRRQLARMLRTEQLLVVLPSAVAGLLLGAVLARLLVPALTLTPTGAVPPLPARVPIPWLAAGLVTAAVAAVPVLIAPLAGRHGSAALALRRGAQE
jgi:hypothetical protein